MNSKSCDFGITRGRLSPGPVTFSAEQSLLIQQPRSVSILIVPARWGGCEKEMRRVCRQRTHWKTAQEGVQTLRS